MVWSWSNPVMSRSESQHCITMEPCISCSDPSMLKLGTLQTAEQSLWPTMRSPVMVVQEESAANLSSVTMTPRGEQPAVREERTEVTLLGFFWL